MADKTTRPTKKRAAKTETAEETTVTKAVKSEKVEAATVSGDAEVTKLLVKLEFEGTKRRFERFNAPEDSGCAGALYVPLGAKSVKVLIEM